MHNSNVEHVEHDTCQTCQAQYIEECISKYINTFFIQQRKISLFFFSHISSKYWSYISTIDQKNLYLKSYLFAIFLYFFCLNTSSCNCCICLSLLCVLVNSSEKCSKCVCVKKSCSFSSQSFFRAKISCLLHACEKLEQNQIIIKKEKEHLIFHLFKFQSKSLYLCCH